MSSVSSQPIIDLFLHQVGWIAPRLPDPSRPGVIAWLARQLTQESQDRLKPMFRLDHAVQLNAENALILLLERTWQQPRPLRRALEIPERQVDWPHTYLTEISRPLERYWTREPILVPDLELRAALVTLAWNCIQLIELGMPGRVHQERRNRLQEAIAAVPLVARRSVAYQRHHEQRLLQGDPAARQAAQALGAWRTFWLHRFGGDSDRAALEELAQRIDASNVENADALLELVATMAIAQAACAGSGADRLSGEEWEIDGPIEQIDSGRPVIRLRSGEFRCGLYKGVPHAPGGGKEAKAKDALTPLLQQLGDERTRGNQPDIVLSFWREGREDEWVAVLADAKRNAKKEDEGRGYLRESVERAAVYAVSYGHLARLRIHAEGEPGFSGPILPVVTLFLRQGVKRVAGIESSSRSPAEVVEALRRPPLPAILAFDIEQHFGLAPGSEGGAPVLAAWFGAIARQACGLLGA